MKPEINKDWYEMVKLELNSAYGMCVSAAYRSMTHAVNGEPVKNIESHDNALCMYDYATEILDEIEGDLK